jgi:hypothetical protein
MRFQLKTMILATIELVIRGCLHVDSEQIKCDSVRTNGQVMSSRSIQQPARFDYMSVQR